MFRVSRKHHMDMFGSDVLVECLVLIPHREWLVQHGSEFFEVKQRLVDMRKFGFS